MGAVEHVADEGKLVFVEELFCQKVFVELDGDFVDFAGLALVGEPGVVEVGSDKYQFFVVDFCDVVSYDPFGAFGIEDEVQFKFFMVMKWEVELAFDTGKECKTIVLGEGCYFPHNILGIHSRWQSLV